MNVNDLSESQACFCGNVSFLASQRQRQTLVTEQDLAQEITAMTLEEREAIHHDIHGVPQDVVEETEDMVNQKIAEMKECFRNMPVSTARAAWDRASYLHPSMADDRDLYLLFLRAMRFKPFQAATRMLKYFEAKRAIWGDDLLIHRISYQDLTTEEQEMALSGWYRLFRTSEKSDSVGRGIAFMQLTQWEASKPKALLRVCDYLGYSILLDDIQMQRNGIINITDCRGQLKSTPFEILQYLVTIAPFWDSAAYHLVADHLIVDGRSFQAHLDRTRAIFGKTKRLRSRLHYGSTLEIDYLLRPHGIHVGDCLDLERSTVEDCLGRDAMLHSIQQTMEKEEKIREVEAPYCDASSAIALYPNPQDILLGHNKAVAVTWPGNIQFRSVISARVGEYIAAERKSKADLAFQILRSIQSNYNARFLDRKTTVWEAADDAEAVKKISQALRNEARRITQPLPV